MEQVGKRAQRVRSSDRRCGAGGAIGPINGNERARLVGKNQQQAQLAGALLAANGLQTAALERVAWPSHDDGLMNVLRRGSVSWFPSIAFTTKG